MISYLSSVFPVILYFLGSILIVVLIILAIRLMNTLDKVDRVVDDVSIKSRKLNGVFNLIDTTADGLTHLSDIAVNLVFNLVNKLLVKKGKKEEEENNE